MELVTIIEKLKLINNDINNAEFIESFNLLKEILFEINKFEKNELTYQILFNIACYCVDIGHMNINSEASEIGIKLFTNYQEKFIELFKENFYYNLGNAKSNLLGNDVNLDIMNNQSFYDIEKLVEIKSNYWKAIKYANKKHPMFPKFTVNLGNSLKRQFRLIEALDCYDRVNKLYLDIPQGWINKAESLVLLHQISDTYSIQMYKQIRQAYRNASNSKNIPPSWIPYYNDQVTYYSDIIQTVCIEENIELDIHDSLNTQKEYESLSDYRKFCLNANLSLSEHGLYCKCYESAIDNLTIPTSNTKEKNFVLPMEQVLNRLKSEFSFARHLYYEYLTHRTPNELYFELGFAPFFNDELLGLDIEKLRTSFRLCFGILDKIGVAICELYNLYPHPQNKIVYFQNFWQLDGNDRREKFNQIKTAGLLALYSIATDLNDKKDGEWAFFKDYRNALEHSFFVIHQNEQPHDLFNSYSFMNDNIVFEQESRFVEHLKLLLQLTRSAIFSFVFMVREEALKDEEAK